MWRSSQDEAAIIDQGVQKVEYVVPASASTQTARMLPPRAESTASQSAIGIEKSLRRAMRYRSWQTSLCRPKQQHGVRAGITACQPGQRGRGGSFFSGAFDA